MTSNAAKIIISPDAKFYVGMTHAEAYTNKSIRNIFASIDENKNGVIEETEIEKYYGSVKECTEQEFEKLFTKNDVENSKIISPDSRFYVGMTHTEAYANKSIRNIFASIDENKNGVIEKIEIEKYYGSVKECTEKEFEKLFTKNNIESSNTTDAIHKSKKKGTESPTSTKSNNLGRRITIYRAAGIL